MKKQFLLLIILSLFIASPVLGGYATPTSGDYLKYCQESIKVYEGKSVDISTANSCIGFVEGALGMHEAFKFLGQGNPFYCIPEHSISSFDIIPIWVEYLENNPQILDKSPLITFILSMSKTFPCTEPKTGE
jgi:hypothetical protein